MRVLLVAALAFAASVVAAPAYPAPETSPCDTPTPTAPLVPETETPGDYGYGGKPVIPGTETPGDYGYGGKPTTPVIPEDVTPTPTDNGYGDYPGETPTEVIPDTETPTDVVPEKETTPCDDDVIPNTETPTATPPIPEDEEDCDEYEEETPSPTPELEAQYLTSPNSGASSNFVNFGAAAIAVAVAALLA